jgi:hypothetical protein
MKAQTLRTPDVGVSHTIQRPPVSVLLVPPRLVGRVSTRLKFVLAV